MSKDLTTSVSLQPPPRSQSNSLNNQQELEGSPPNYDTHAQSFAVAPSGATYPFGQVPADIECQYCKANVRTITTYQAGLLTWILAIVLCIGCCCVAGIIPFCCNATKDVKHTCPNCRSYVGKFKGIT